MALSRRHTELDAALLAAIQAQPGRTGPQIARAVCGRAARYTQAFARLVGQQRIRTERCRQSDGLVVLTYWPAT